MTKFYKKTDEGEYIEADNDVDELFRQKSDGIIKAKLEKARERETEKIRQEIEAEVRETTEAKIKSEVEEGLKVKWQEKLDESENKVKKLDTALRRKTIAAEYGFKPDAEQFLGDGDDDDMRAKADTLKASFTSNGTSTKMEKQTTSGDDGDSFVKLVK